MPLRRTKRSNGRPRPRWKDGSHLTVENTHANKSRCNKTALESNRQIEPLVTVPPLLKRNHEKNVSTRDRLARTGADARIEESAAMGEVCLALRPYGRKFKLDFHQCPIRKILLNTAQTCPQRATTLEGLNGAGHARTTSTTARPPSRCPMPTVNASRRPPEGSTNPE
jgi:hypothetical protein